MNSMQSLSFAIVGAVVLLGSTDANAQYYNDYVPGQYIDQYGRIIGRYGRVAIIPHSVYGAPHTSPYFSRNGLNSFDPQIYGGSSPTIVPPQVEFGAYSHVDDLAIQLETLVNEFCLDLYYNYSHNYDFMATYREAYQILEISRFIHAAEHIYDRDAIRSKLGGLDALFRHVQDDVRGWTRLHHRQIGRFGIQAKMDLIDSTLQHLMNDVGVTLTPTVDGPVGAPLTVPVEPPPTPAPNVP